MSKEDKINIGPGKVNWILKTPTKTPTEEDIETILKQMDKVLDAHARILDIIAPDVAIKNNKFSIIGIDDLPEL